MKKNFLISYKDLQRALCRWKANNGEAEKASSWWINNERYNPKKWSLLSTHAQKTEREYHQFEKIKEVIYQLGRYFHMQPFQSPNAHLLPWEKSQTEKRIDWEFQLLSEKISN